MCLSLVLVTRNYYVYFTHVSCFSVRGDLLCIAILLNVYLWLLVVIVMMITMIRWLLLRKPGTGDKARCEEKREREEKRGAESINRMEPANPATGVCSHWPHFSFASILAFSLWMGTNLIWIQKPSFTVNLITKRSRFAGENVEERVPLDTVGGHVNWYSHYRKQHGRSSGSSNPASGYIAKESETIILKRYLYSKFIAALCTTTKIRKNVIVSQ